MTHYENNHIIGWLFSKLLAADVLYVEKGKFF